MSERVPIRGPDAGQSRQPQRVPPGGFFRPLFGRSKRGHPDGFDRQDGYMKTEVRSCTFVEPQGREDASLRSILRPSPEGRDSAEDRLSVVAHAIGPSTTGWAFP